MREMTTANSIVSGVPSVDLRGSASKEFMTSRHDFIGDWVDPSPATSECTRSPRGSLNFDSSPRSSKGAEGDSFKGSEDGSAQIGKMDCDYYRHPATGSAIDGQSPQILEIIDLAEKRRLNLQGVVDDFRSKVRSISPMRTVAPFRDSGGNPLTQSRGRLETPPINTTKERQASGSPATTRVRSISPAINTTKERQASSLLAPTRVRSITPPRIVAPTRDSEGNLLIKTRGRLETPTKSTAAERQAIASPVFTSAQRAASPPRMVLEKAISTNVLLSSNEDTQRSSCPSPVRSCARLASQGAWARATTPVRAYMRQPSPIANVAVQRAASPAFGRVASPIRTCIRAVSPVTTYIREIREPSPVRACTPVRACNYRQASPSPVRAFPLAPVFSASSPGLPLIMQAGVQTRESSLPWTRANTYQVAQAAADRRAWASIPDGCWTDSAATYPAYSPVTAPRLMPSFSQPSMAPAATSNHFLLGATSAFHVAQHPQHQPKPLIRQESFCMPVTTPAPHLFAADSCFAKDFD